MKLDAKDILLGALALLTVWYVYRLLSALRAAAREAREAREPPWIKPRAGLLATGFITNFFDTLGIGSFAPTTAMFRRFRLVRDEEIPGTLHAGHTIPSIVQAFLFTKLVNVDAQTLILMIVAAVGGAWLGAGAVSRWPRRWVQLGMGSALLAAAMLMLVTLVKAGPGGGNLLALPVAKLLVAIGVNALLGALMTLGIGLYAPCMILVSLLGMNPTACFPIMMGSCAFLMPVAGDRFMRARRFDPAATIGLLCGGVPAVLLAVSLVGKLPLDAVRGLVIVVVVYTAVGMLRAALTARSDVS